MTATVSTAALISAAADIATEARSVLSALASVLDRLAGSADIDLGETARQIAQLPSYTSVGIDSPYALFAGALDVLAHAQEATRDGAQQDADTVREILDVLASLPLGASPAPVQQEPQEVIEEKAGEPSLTDLETAAEDRRLAESEGGWRAALVDAMDRHAAESVALEEAAREEERQALKPIAEAYKEPAPEEAVTTAANPPAAEEEAAPLAPAHRFEESQHLEATVPDEDEETEEDGGTDEDDDQGSPLTLKEAGRMRKPELRDLAMRLKVNITTDATKADIIEALQQAGAVLQG